MENKLIFYINGILYGLKIAVKLCARIEDNKKLINVLCSIQKDITEKSFSNNCELWQYIEVNYIKKFPYNF